MIQPEANLLCIMIPSELGSPMLAPPNDEESEDDIDVEALFKAVNHNKMLVQPPFHLIPQAQFHDDPSLFLHSILV